MRWHSAVPFHLVRNGWALPAWHYFLEVTRRCNLRCRMCQYLEWFDRHKPADLIASELTTEEWRRVIDQTGRWSLITFTGGEPWVRDDFLEILAHASGKRRTHVITNGLLLGEDGTRRCVELAPNRLTGKGLSFLGVSVDGPPTVHDAIRDREGAFDETMAAIRRLAEGRRATGKQCPMIHVTAVVQDANLEALPELAGLCAQAGADVLNLTLEIRFLSHEQLGKVDPAELAADARELPRLEPERLRKCLDATRHAAEEAGIELRTPDMPDEQILNYHNGGLDLAAFSCRGVWTNVQIGAQGDVFPCFLQKVGSVRENDLATIWNSPEMRAFRRRIRTRPFPICQGCCNLEYARPRKNPDHDH